MAPADAIAAARAELLEHVRPPAPPAAEEARPTEWVYGWLEGHGLATYAAALLEHNFATREDLTLPPRLTLHELETKLGVDKAADARKLLKLIGEL